MLELASMRAQIRQYSTVCKQEWGPTNIPTYEHYKYYNKMRIRLDNAHVVRNQRGLREYMQWCLGARAAVDGETN